MESKRIKKFNKENMCVVCQGELNFLEDRYVNLRDYNKGKYESQCFYHLQCWKDREQIMFDKMKTNTLGFMSNLFKRKEVLV